MNKIKGLMAKDFLNLKSYTKTLLFMIVLFLVVGLTNNNLLTFVPVVLPLCFGMVGMSSFSYDNIAKSDKFVLTFPINRKDMVKSRYLYILALTVIGAIIGAILCIIMQSIKEKALVNIGDIFSISLGAFCGMMMLQTFEIPIMYKFGAEKGRIIQMIAIVLIMILISSGTALIIKISPFSLDDFLSMLQKYGLAVITLAVSIFYIISYKVSLKIYSKKEI